MASRRVSISALLCEDDPSATSASRPPQSSSPPRVPTRSPDFLAPARQHHHAPHPRQTPAPRRTASPEFTHPALYSWPPPSSSRRAYNPSSGMVPSVQANQYEPESPRLRTGQQPYIPPSSPRPSYSQSPFPTTRLSSDSPASTISLTHTPSIHSPSSPLLYTQRPTPSSVGYYSPPSVASQYDSPFQVAVSPTLRHPRHNHPEPMTSSSTHHSSLSRISTASSSSFPQALLNPVSPQKSPLGGLEALVQAATVERDRLEAKANLDRKGDTSRSMARRSPELLIRPPQEGSRIHLQPPAPATPVTSSLIPGTLLRDSYSESSLRMGPGPGPGPEAHPAKRQRPLDLHSGADHSWDLSSPWDSSQFSGLMGPGIKPRRPSSEVRTEVHPTLPVASRDKEEASTAGRRLSPTRERPARRQYIAEERSFPSHVSSHREPVISPVTTSDDRQHVVVAEEPPSIARQVSQPNVDLHPPPPGISRSDLVLKTQSPPPSLPPPRASFTPSEPPVPPAPTQRQQSPPPGKEDTCSGLHALPPSLSNILAPVATAMPKSLEPESSTGSEKSIHPTTPRASSIQEPSAALVEPLPPDGLTATVQDSPLILASPSTLNAHGDDLGSAEPIKPPSPTLPSPETHNKDITVAPQGTRSPLGISKPSSPPREDVLHPPTTEPEAYPPPTTASPSPQALSPAAPSLQDGTNDDQLMEIQTTAPSGTSTNIPATDLQSPVDARTSFTPLTEPEAVESPVTVPQAPEVIPLPMADAPPRIDDTPIAVIDDEGKSEASLEAGIALDFKQSQIAEQSPADMDVDEELLSLIADDLPSRSSRTMLRKQELSSSEDKRPRSYLAPFKQESAMGTPTSSQPSPAPSSIVFNLEIASTQSPDPPASARESEMSTVKLEERPTQKKKTKQHAQPKSRPKQSGSAKTKLKISSDGPSTAPLKSKKSSNTVTKRSIISARSRSTSVMPVSITPAPGAENRAPGETELEDIEDGMEDKLYCVCETRYDDEKVMIACDRCDEWYHTSCVNMPDQEVDLVDQFICPLCVEKNPHLDLRTTWKRRCLNGLKQHNPNSPDACHKPARGAFSKYCSDECGVQYMHMRISLWVENGGQRDRLWETVKNAERREGVVVSARLFEAQSRSPTITGDQAALPVVPPKISKTNRELARLRARLETMVQKREALKAEMDVVAWREKVTELAIQHAETIEQCGWDQRLCFGDEEVAEFGASVLESYEENHSQADVDGTQEEAEWWCTGKKKCDRHSGWQKLRVADVEFDKETKDQALQKLTKLEREIRKRVEDILDPHAHPDKAKMLEPTSPRVPVLSRTAVNGQPKHRPNGDHTKKGKKKKE